MNLRTAVGKINQRGMLLVFPLANRKEPPSLWSEMYPRSQMRWEWDEDGDNRVAGLWRLRERLSTSGQAVYSKWYRGRATLISRDLFRAMLASLGTASPRGPGSLSFQAREVLDLLQEDSPLSTKQLKKLSGLTGREMERNYNAALKQLWSKLLIVAYGEVDEGAFPSLAIGATERMFEDLWQESRELDPAKALAEVHEVLRPKTPFRKYFDEVQAYASAKAEEEPGPWLD